MIPKSVQTILKFMNASKVTANTLAELLPHVGIKVDEAILDAFLNLIDEKKKVGNGSLLAVVEDPEVADLILALQQPVMEKVLGDNDTRTFSQCPECGSVYPLR
jgi:uncharacterized protein YjgD (DUF1641 family)